MLTECPTSTACSRPSFRSRSRAGRPRTRPGSCSGRARRRGDPTSRALEVVEKHDLVGVLERSRHDLPHALVTAKAVGEHHRRPVRSSGHGHVVTGEYVHGAEPTCACCAGEPASRSSGTVPGGVGRPVGVGEVHVGGAANFRPSNRSSPATPSAASWARARTTWRPASTPLPFSKSVVRTSADRRLTTEFVDTLGFDASPPGPLAGAGPRPSHGRRRRPVRHAHGRVPGAQPGAAPAHPRRRPHHPDEVVRPPPATWPSRVSTPS